MAATTLCLLAAGAAVITGMCGLVARDYLQGQADRQLRACAGRLVSRPFEASPLYGVALGVSGPLHPVAVGPPRSLYGHAAGPPGPVYEVAVDAAGAGGCSDGLSIEVRGPAGQVVIRTAFAGPPGPVIPVVPAVVAAHAGQPATVAAGGSGSSWRVITEPVHYQARRIPFSFSAEGFDLAITSTARPGLAGTLVIGLDLRGAGQVIGRLVAAGLVLSGVVILAVTCLAVVVSRALLRPVAQARQALAAGQLSHRVPDRRHDEAGRLAVSLNTMLSQLEQASRTRGASEAAARASRAQIGRIIADTVHQLRKPLSIIHGIAVSYRRGGRPSAGELDHIMRRLAGEAARIESLLDQLPPAQGDQPPPQR